MTKFFFALHWNKNYVALTNSLYFFISLLTPAKSLIFMNRIENAVLLIFLVEFWVLQRVSEVTPTLKSYNYRLSV